MVKENKKIPYEEAKLEIILIAANDIITTSGDELGEGVDIDDGAWT